MNSLDAIACPHCGQSNTVGGSFCESCGQALPSGAGGPRVVEGAALATTGAGASLQSAELQKKARSAAGALLAVAILQSIAVVVFYFILKSVEGAPDVPEGTAISTALILGAIAAVFWGLWWWARFNPLPAAIVGLVLYLSLWLLDILMDPSAVFNGILIRVIILVVLGKAIQAGAQHRQLVKQQS